MRNMILLSSLIAGISACSSDNAPTPSKVAQNVQTLAPGTVISAIAKQTHKVPQGAQVIEDTGVYVTTDNTYDRDGYDILVPKGALIKGTYTNDGTSCKVTWKAIYINEDEYENDRGSLILGKTTKPSLCKPEKGIKSGNRVTIRFGNTDLAD